MTFTELYNNLPLLGFILVVLYTLLGILRIKRLLRVPLLILIILMGIIPGIWFALPVFAVFELTMQIMRFIKPLLMDKSS
ncbi:hypothetical protein SAMN05428642_105152 [Flaviramulus basaltis]|uniref:Uncharacterized protein n=1 Tax=Flaviramulus basaltis TaxID=369401 RepID=A0A1K2IR14_9FLAO|nr:hypothetical protein SAMN05428642_105152 [Flaviramulus basaltis]